MIVAVKNNAQLFRKNHIASCVAKGENNEKGNKFVYEICDVHGLPASFQSVLEPPVYPCSLYKG